MIGCKHLVCVVTEDVSRVDGKVVSTPVTPYVEVENDEDGYYKQGFESWQEVDEFIASLRAAATTAFGEKK